jgi:hypothetical protein
MIRARLEAPASRDADRRDLRRAAPHARAGLRSGRALFLPGSRRGEAGTDGALVGGSNFFAFPRGAALSPRRRLIDWQVATPRAEAATKNRRARRRSQLPWGCFMWNSAAAAERGERLRGGSCGELRERAEVDARGPRSGGLSPTISPFGVMLTPRALRAARWAGEEIALRDRRRQRTNGTMDLPAFPTRKRERSSCTPPA